MQEQRRQLAGEHLNSMLTSAQCKWSIYGIAANGLLLLTTYIRGGDLDDVTPNLTVVIKHRMLPNRNPDSMSNSNSY